MEKQYLSIDVGGTKLKYGLLDATGHLLFTGSQATPNKDLEGFLTAIFALVDRFQTKIGGIAISIPGKVDVRHAVIYHGGSLPFLDTVPLASLLKNRYQLTVNIENDGKCTVLGEYWQGHLSGKDNSAAIVLGTAVGGGLILNGHVRAGAHLQAGEISFMLLPNNQQQVAGDQCSAVRLVTRLAEVLELPATTSGELVFEQLATTHNAAALILFTAYCRQIATLILNIQVINDLTDFVIGGGISSQSLVTETINQQYDDLLLTYPNVKEAIVRPKIRTAKFGNQANLYGALYSFLTNQ